MIMISHVAGVTALYSVAIVSVLLIVSFLVRRRTGIGLLINDSNSIRRLIRGTLFINQQQQIIHICCGPTEQLLLLTPTTAVKIAEWQDEPIKQESQDSQFSEVE